MAPKEPDIRYGFGTEHYSREPEMFNIPKVICFKRHNMKLFLGVLSGFILGILCGLIIALS